jgi:hypothetical protein
MGKNEPAGTYVVTDAMKTAPVLIHHYDVFCRPTFLRAGPLCWGPSHEYSLQAAERRSFGRAPSEVPTEGFSRRSLRKSVFLGLGSLDIGGVSESELC